MPIVQFFPVYLFAEKMRTTPAAIKSQEISLTTPESQVRTLAASVRSLEERLRGATNQKEEAGKIDEAQRAKLESKIQSLRNQLVEAKEIIVEQREKLKRRRRRQIRRTLRFSPIHYQAGLTLLSYFAEIVKHKYPNVPVSVSIIQERDTITLIIESPDGLREKIAKTLKDYEEVLAGKRRPEDFLDDRAAIGNLEHRLMVAVAELERAKKQITARDAILAERQIEEGENERLRRDPSPEQLFVAFADLVGSSSLNEQEKIKATMILQTCAKAFGKTYKARHANTWGDAVLNCFGSVTETFDFSRQLMAGLSTAKIRARIGINFGAVTVYLNELLNRADVRGPAVDFAARLEQMALGGEILVGPDVYHHPDAGGFRNLRQTTRKLKKTLGALRAGTKIECFVLSSNRD